MRAFLAVLLPCVALLAGCADPDPPAPVADLVLPPPEPPAGVLRVADDGLGNVSYAIDQAGLAYAGALARFVLVAEGDVEVHAAWTGQVPAAASEGGCVAGALLAPEREAYSYAVAWVIPTNLTVQARVLGQNVQHEPTSGGAAAGAFLIEAGLEAWISAGERVVVELGGSSPGLFALDPGAHSEVTLNVTGPHRWEQAAVPMACGVGAHAASGGAGATWYLAEAEVGGAVVFDSKHAATALAGKTGRLPFTGHRVEFLGQGEALGNEFRASAPEGGRMALHFDRHAGLTTDVAWFFADTEWPVDG